MIALLVGGLIMGQRHVGKLSVFDLLTGIAIGAVAGAGIVDPDLPHLGVLVSVLSLAVLHWVVTWVTMKWKGFGRMTTFEPIVVVRKGKPVRAAMQRIRFALSDLLPLLREKEIFDLQKVEYAILEADGELTVLRASDPEAKNGLPRAVVVDGQIDKQVLGGTNWDEQRLLSEVMRRGYDGPEDLFIATLDDAENLYIVAREMKDDGPVIHH